MISSLPPLHIIFAWLLGHKSILGNERADELAKQAATILPAPNVPATTIDVKAFLKFHLFQEWKRGWENAPTMNKLKNVKPSAEFRTTALRTNRKEEVSLCRLRIDHTRITHSHLLTKTPPPLCQSCSVQITVQHLHRMFCTSKLMYQIQSSIFR